ncbi:NAD(P)H-binding protein [Thalassomonas sp. RHCl1]|uniref:SDR family oxidoreductase n=1 Tax=Thalassomonas sp. RHCl1 TaxID=2995320 RepID=UPI00248CC43D|nr:NAD(P)H-binding protein [Thalassomonas sp. RHCl1]
MSNKTLTVIGATGNLSVPVIKRLVEKGVSVKAVVRNLDKAKLLLPPAVELVYGDVENLASLNTALAGSEQVYIHLNTTSLDESLPFHPERDGVKNIVTAAENNNVKQLIQIGGIESLHPEFAVEGLALKTSLIRDQGMSYVKASGIPHTLLFCSFFADSFPLYVQDKLFAIIGDLKYPLYFTNTNQLANSLYKAIANPDACNRSFAIQGREAMTFPEAAKRFVKHFDPEIAIEQFPIEAIAQMGMPEEQAMFMEHLMLFVEQLSEQAVAGESQQVLGEPEMGFDDFIKQLN